MEIPKIAKVELLVCGVGFEGVTLVWHVAWMMNRQDVIVRLSYQVQTLQTALHGAELQNQQLRTRVVEMESREGILMSHMLWMEECLTVLEKRLSGPPSGTQ
nr:hypothetical protein [Tanacetum cinerariifolium]